MRAGVPRGRICSNARTVSARIMMHRSRVAHLGLTALLICAACARAEDAGAAAGEAAEAADQNDAAARDDAQMQPEFEEPMVEAAAIFETFQSDPFASGRWVKSTKAKYAEQAVEIGQGAKGSALEGDQALVLKKPAKHYGLVGPLPEPFTLKDEDLVFQYEVRLHDGQDCGGAYVKLLHADEMGSPAQLEDSTPFVVMFGPDKCGASNKVHMIVRHQNPVSGKWNEHHVKDAPTFPDDTASHQYSLVMRRDNTFAIAIDGTEKRSGSLLEDLEPPINPAKQIPDPEARKPADWVDEAKITDPEAVKPDDWDEEAPTEVEDPDAVKPAGWLDNEPEYVPDPEAEQPDDWDEEEDGAWEAPMVPNPRCAEAPGCGEWTRPMKANPEYKGKWSPPMIDNPEYKGEWKAPMIDNPDWFEDSNPHNSLAPIGAVAIEVWTMSGGIAFDNILLSHDEGEAASVAAASFDKRKAFEEMSEREQKRRAARRDRLAALARGGVEGYLTYASGEAMELAADNPLATVGVFVAVLAVAVVLCVRCTVGADEGDEEEELLRQAMQQARGEASAGRDERAADGASGEEEEEGKEGEEDEEGEVEEEEEEDKAEKEVKAEPVRAQEAAASAAPRRRRRRTTRAE